MCLVKFDALLKFIWGNWKEKERLILSGKQKKKIKKIKSSPFFLQNNWKIKKLGSQLGL